MPPVHRTPAGVIKVVLIKQVIRSLIVGKTIGIIHPPHLGCYVEQGTFFGFDFSAVDFFIISGLNQAVTVHLNDLFSSKPELETGSIFL
jgi:hypothetical protein